MNKIKFYSSGFKTLQQGKKTSSFDIPCSLFDIRIFYSPRIGRTSPGPPLEAEGLEKTKQPSSVKRGV